MGLNSKYVAVLIEGKYRINVHRKYISKIIHVRTPEKTKQNQKISFLISSRLLITKKWNLSIL